MNRLKTLMFIALAVLVALGCSDTAWAEGVTLTVTPTSLAFNNIPSNSMSQPQTLQISSNQSTSVVIQTTQSWISISTSVLNIGTSATPLTVRANTQGLPQGSYTGSIVVTVSGQTSIQQTVGVSLSVSGTSLLTANPSTLSFSAQVGATSATPTSSPVQIISSGAALNYTLTAQTQSGSGNWLLLSTLSGTSGGAGFNVSVNPSGLQAGSYTATITAQSTTTSDSVQISVTLAVNTNATLSVSPATPPPFLWQIGAANPSAQQLTVSAANGTVQFNVTVSPQVTWLVVSPLSGQAGTNPATVTLSPNPAGAGLTAGSYTTSVIISSGSNQVTVPVKLIAASHPLLQLSTNSLAFSGGFASQQSPPDQQVMVTASDASTQSFNYTSDSAWLTLKTTGGFSTSGSGATPVALTVHVNPAGLQVGTYNGTIQIIPTNGDSYTETVSVSFAVGAASTLLAGPQNLLFSYQTGQNPPGVQNISVQSTGQPLAFTVATSTTVSTNCPGGWLNATASSGTTPATVTVSVSVSGLSAGLCSGAISLNYNSGSGQASVPLGVSVAISAANKPELTVSMASGFGLESAALGASTYTRTIALGSTSLATSVDFTATATSVPTWLTVGPGSGTTPANLVVVIQPGVLTTPGQYMGSITISSTTLPAQLAIPILLTITSNVNVTVAPTSLSFTEAQLGPLPAAQNLTLTSTGGTASFTSSIQYNSGSNWLQVTPGSGTASGNLQVSIQPNSLSQGTYTAQITLAYQGASSAGAVIPVTLTVGPQQTLSVAPSSLSFSYQIGGTQPPAQSLSLTTTGGSVQFSLGTTSSGWLMAEVTSGSAPRNVAISVNTTGLTAGTYMGSISITAPNVLTNAIVVNVTLTVAAAPVPQPITVQSAASFQFGVIAPGELITVKGNQLGPASPPNGVSFTLNSQGGVDPKLAGVRVLFDNNPGTPIYVSAGQINAIVPWEIAGRPSTNLVIEVNGIQSAPIPLTLSNQAPGLFTTTQNGAGQVAAINQNGTYNGPPGGGFSPAPVGSVISVYGTGGGQTSPPGTTGSVTPTPTSAAGPFLRISNVTATIGNQPATVTFAGAAPGLVTGVIQINIIVPAGVSGNNLPISVSINGVATPLVGTTVAVSSGG